VHVNAGVAAPVAAVVVGKRRDFGNPAQLGIQGVAVLASIVYSGVFTVVLLKLIGAVVPFRTDAEQESIGLDVTQHGEEAYVHAQGSGNLSMQN
jgi:Amt family ammonium transporter